MTEQSSINTSINTLVNTSINTQKQSSRKFQNNLSTILPNIIEMSLLEIKPNDTNYSKSLKTIIKKIIAKRETIDTTSLNPSLVISINNFLIQANMAKDKTHNSICWECIHSSGGIGTPCVKSSSIKQIPLNENPPMPEGSIYTSTIIKSNLKDIDIASVDTIYCPEFSIDYTRPQEPSMLIPILCFWSCLNKKDKDKYGVNFNYVSHYINKFVAKYRQLFPQLDTHCNGLFQLKAKESSYAIMLSKEKNTSLLEDNED